MIEKIEKPRVANTWWTLNLVAAIEPLPLQDQLSMWPAIATRALWYMPNSTVEARESTGDDHQKSEAAAP
jgi:hypothetical protein